MLNGRDVTLQRPRRERSLQAAEACEYKSSTRIHLGAGASVPASRPGARRERSLQAAEACEYKSSVRIDLGGGASVLASRFG
jgi:hypothetical protein